MVSIVFLVSYVLLLPNIISEECVSQSCVTTNQPKKVLELQEKVEGDSYFEKVSDQLLHQHLQQNKILDEENECPVGLWHEGRYIPGEELQKFRDEQNKFGEKFLKTMSNLKAEDFALPRFAKVYLERLKSNENKPQQY